MAVKITQLFMFQCNFCKPILFVATLKPGAEMRKLFLKSEKENINIIKQKRNFFFNLKMVNETSGSHGNNYI